MIVDGTDNFPTRYLVNDACVLLGKPNVYGSIFRFDGQASVFFPPHGPCYRCLYPEPPPPDLVPNCAEGGVLGILPGVIGVIQATETVKLILGVGKPLIGRLMLYDALDMTFREMKVRKNPKCPICGPNPTITGLIDYEEFCGVRGVEAAPAVGRRPATTITPARAEGPARPGRAPVHPRRPEPRGDRDLPDRRLDRDPAPRASRAGSASSTRRSPMVVHCKSGARSAKAIALMQGAGFSRLSNLTGGILGLDQGRRPEPAELLRGRRAGRGACSPCFPIATRPGSDLNRGSYWP